MKHHSPVRPKKFLGQHFLRDEAVATAIADALVLPEGISDVLEIGPGTGVLTKYLLRRSDLQLHAIELDRDSVPYLREHYPDLSPRLMEADFLQFDLAAYFKNSFALIGNFPYNISTQILFRLLEMRQSIPVMVGMFQKEVAERLVSGPGNRDYGILSVLLQPWYEMEYLFTVPETAFEPPPRVQSAVIRLTRNSRQELRCEEDFFRLTVKTGFNQRRKTLRNALRPLLPPDFSAIPYLDLRAEALSWQQFEELACLLKV